jgi:purine-binding chemotaxis protein CheW
MKLDFMRMDMDLIKADEHKLVGFTIDDVCYGIDIMDVREVINPSDLIKVPTLPKYVLGVADHRDDVVPIVDLRSRFGLAPVERTKRIKWIVLQLPNGAVGLEVDRVIQVITVDRSMKQDKLNMATRDEPWIRSVYRTSEYLVFKLNLEILVDAGQLNLDPDVVRNSRS